MDLVLAMLARRFRMLGVLSLLLLGGCHSFACRRIDYVVHHPNGVARAGVWISDQGIYDGVSPAWQVVCAVGLYPLNIVAGILAGPLAIVDGDYEIRYGVAGWVAGCLVPGLTVMPSLKWDTSGEMHLTDKEWSDFVRGAVNDKEQSDSHGWHSGGRWLRVELESGTK